MGLYHKIVKKQIYFCNNSPHQLCKKKQKNNQSIHIYIWTGHLSDRAHKKAHDPFYISIFLCYATVTWYNYFVTLLKMSFTTCINLEQDRDWIEKPMILYIQNTISIGLIATIMVSHRLWWLSHKAKSVNFMQMCYKNGWLRQQAKKSLKKQVARKTM